MSNDLCRLHSRVHPRRRAGHYADLDARTGSAIVRLNRAVAVAEVQGPRAGLALIAGLDEVLRDNHRVAAVRAELARRVGDIELARASYRKAIGLCANDVERTHLRARLDATTLPTHEHSKTKPSHPPLHPTTS